jgi:hypothetical protein
MSDKTQTVDDYQVVDRPIEEKSGPDVRDMDILEALLSNKAIQKVFKTSRGEFTVRYPSGSDRLKIDQYRAMRRRGIPSDTFDDVANINNNIWSTLDVVVVDGPNWYTNIKAKNPTWSWEEGPDDELTLELYNLVSTFRSEIALKIHNSEYGRVVEKGVVSENSTPMGGGTFSGLTNGPKA